MNYALCHPQEDPQALWRYQAVDSLYDTAIRALEGLDGSMEKGDIESCANHLGEAVAAISFLLEAVDVDAGGEAGRFLYGLYSRILERLSTVLVSRDRDTVQLCGRYLVHLRMLWRERVLGASQVVGAGTAGPGRDVARGFSGSPCRP